MTARSLDALVAALDIIAEAKSDDSDSYVMGVLAGVEDSIEAAQADICDWLGSEGRT